METEQPRVIILAGPNGAGKSTAAMDFLQGTLGVLEYVNADAIARGLSGFQPERAALEAGKITIRRLHELAQQRAHFAFETTLASRSIARSITEWRRSGYALHLLFLWLPSPDMAVKRVLDRVRLGGHNVPEETIRRRYHRGLHNFFHLYRPLADHWRFYDNSNPTGMRLIAAGDRHGETVQDPETWEQIAKGVVHEGSEQEPD
jgi:predicted ABC-type ATPase